MQLFINTQAHQIIKYSEAATGGVLLKRWPATLLKNRLWYRCFPVNFAKLLRRPFFTEHLWTTASE